MAHIIIHRNIDCNKVTTSRHSTYAEAYREYQSLLARDKYRMEIYSVKARSHSYTIRSATGQKSKLVLIKIK